MKKYYLLYIVGLSFFVTACSSLTEQKINFEGWNINIKLPGQYKSYNYEELAELIESTDVKEKNVVLGTYLIQLMFNKEMRVLIDSTSFYNCIAISRFDISIYFKREFLKAAGDITTLRLTRLYKKVGGDVDPIEGLIRNGRHYQYMKLKYKLLFNGKEFFYANYLLRLKEKTISIAVLNEVDEDFEDSIAEVAIYSLNKTSE